MMEINVTKSTGEFYSNQKTMKKLVFPNVKEKMRYLITFLSKKATDKTSKDNPSHLKGAKFMFIKDNGKTFDEVEYTIPGTEKEIDVLLNIVYG